MSKTAAESIAPAANDKCSYRHENQEKKPQQKETCWKKTYLQTEFTPGETESNTPCKEIMIRAPFRHCYHHIITDAYWGGFDIGYCTDIYYLRARNEQGNLYICFIRVFHKALHEQPLKNKANARDKVLLNQWGFTLTPYEPLLLTSMPQFCHIYTETFLHRSLNSKSMMAKVTYFS